MWTDRSEAVTMEGRDGEKTHNGIETERGAVKRGVETRRDGEKTHNGIETREWGS